MFFYCDGLDYLNSNKRVMQRNKHLIRTKAERWKYLWTFNPFIINLSATDLDTASKVTNSNSITNE